ncbi:hypothetical protein ACQ86O_00445 [Serratia sp. L9]|uniref:hypothetical protein n=1 Tax=Serratia sp. L9 TaxID=3423946 RepID=UPI003D66D29B
MGLAGILTRGSQFYPCAIKVQAARDVLRYVGTTRCAGVTMASIPSAGQRQALLLTGRQNPGSDVPVAMRKGDYLSSHWLAGVI